MNNIKTGFKYVFILAQSKNVPRMKFCGATMTMFCILLPDIIKSRLFNTD